MLYIYIIIEKNRGMIIAVYVVHLFVLGETIIIVLSELLYSLSSLCVLSISFFKFIFVVTRLEIQELRPW